MVAIRVLVSLTNFILNGFETDTGLQRREYAMSGFSPILLYKTRNLYSLQPWTYVLLEDNFT